MKIENWHGYDIRFLEIDGEWYAVLKDICDALKLRTDKVAQRIPTECLERVSVEGSIALPTDYKKMITLERGLSFSDNLNTECKIKAHETVKKITKAEIGKDIGKQTHARRHKMLVVNEFGIYEALFASRKLEARKFRMWTASVLQKLRKDVGLEGFEVLRMTEPKIQEQIDWIFDSIFYDPERDEVMIGVTVPGGDVEIMPYDSWERGKVYGSKYL